jgi:beta-glucanase (GH16 family)
MRTFLWAAMIAWVPVANAVTAADQADATADGYRLVWADEFDKDGKLNEKNWTCEKGFVRNHELQWYQSENAFCEKGSLVLEGRRETKSNPDYAAGSTDWKKSRKQIEYTSASVTTRGLHEWQYGRFEIRARIDTHPGLWPAFWTLGAVGQWPSNGEIDVMEYYRDTLLANVAWGTNERWKAKWNSVKKPLAEFKDPGWAKKFHVWRMDWDEQAIKLYVDGDLLNTTQLKDTINGDAERRNPFKQKHFILLNLAVGGDNGGDPSKTDFPARYEIDYVRVFQKK